MSRPNDNFNNGVIGNGWTVYGGSAVEEINGQLEISPPADFSWVGVKWNDGTFDIRTMLPFRIFNLGTLGFNIVYTYVTIKDEVSGYYIQVTFRSGWTTQVRYFDAANVQIGATVEATTSVGDEDSYMGIIWEDGVLNAGTEPGLRVMVSTDAALTETNRSIVWGNVGPIPAAFAAAFNPATVSFQLLGARVNGAGIIPFVEVGDATGDGNVAGGPTSTLTADPISLTFEADLGAADPADQTITITNPAGLAGLAITEQTDLGWLEIVSVVGGVVTIRANTDFVATGGIYEGAIVATQAGATNSPLVIPVTFGVNEVEPPPPGEELSGLFATQVSGPIGVMDLVFNETTTPTQITAVPTANLQFLGAGNYTLKWAIQSTDPDWDGVIQYFTLELVVVGGGPSAGRRQKLRKRNKLVEVAPNTWVPIPTITRG